MNGLVMRGLDPRIHHASQDSFQEDGWPGHPAKTRFALVPGHDEVLGEERHVVDAP
jgi:hypothetical protein